MQIDTVRAQLAEEKENTARVKKEISVLLRHCGKRGGKIRPTTLDFANQDVQVLNDRHRHLFVDRNNSIFFVHGCGHASLHGGPYGP